MANKVKEEFFDAVMYGEADKVKSILDKGFNPNEKGSNGTALEIATWYGNEEIAKLLLEKGANPNLNKGAAVLKAVVSGNKESVDMLKLLVSYKAKINEAFVYDSSLDGSLLMIAIGQGKLKLAYALIDLGINLEMKSKSGETAFSLAGQNGYSKLGKAILDKGYKPELKKKTVKAFYDKIQKEKELHDNYLEKVYELDFTKKKTEHYTGNPQLKEVYNGKNFPSCSNPPVHLLSIDLSKIPELPSQIKSIKQLNVVYQNCEDCDGEDYVDFQIEKDARLKVISESENEEPECEKESYHNSTKIDYLELKEATPGSYAKSGITIGGTPKWVQSPNWTCCPKCGETQFYICSIYQFQVPPTARGAGNHIYVFVCPDCKIESIVRQMT